MTKKPALDDQMKAAGVKASKVNPDRLRAVLKDNKQEVSREDREPTLA